MNWTPGPWTTRRANGTAKADERNDIAIISRENQILAEVFHRTGEDVYQPVPTNAQLISAAPEMAEALEQTLWLIEKGRNSSVAKLRQIATVARAALAKARGE